MSTKRLILLADLRGAVENYEGTAHEARCATCKHWNPPRGELPWGQCARIEDSSDVAEDDLAHATTAYDAAAVRTRPEFGCVLWEAKPPP